MTATAYYSDDHCTLHHGQALEVLRSLPAIHRENRVESGTETSPRGVLGRSASGGSNPYEGGALPEFTAPKIRIRKIGDRWLVICPCGYIWTTEHHRLALLFATDHTHGCAA